METLIYGVAAVASLVLSCFEHAKRAAAGRYARKG